MSILTKIAAVASLSYVGYNFAKSAADNVWNNVKLSLPPETIKAKFTSFTNFQLQGALKIENHYHQSVDITNLKLSVFYKTPDGNLVELASTPPNVNRWVVKKNDTSLIGPIVLNVNNYEALKSLKLLIKAPVGERVKLVVSGYLNGLPLSTEIWY
jgi:hypothetical protein